MAYYSEVWPILTITLFAVPLLPLLALGILALRNVKNFGDEVRHGLIWFHCAIWFYFTALLLMTIAVSITLGMAYSGRDLGYDGVVALGHFTGVATLLEVFGFFTLVMSIAHLAIGARDIDTQKKSSSYRNCMRFFIGLATILYAAYFIFNRWSSTVQRRPDRNYYPSRNYHTTRVAFTIIGLIVVVCVLLATIITTVWASVMASKASKARKAHRDADETGVFYAESESTKGVWGLIIAASSISLVMCIWDLLNYVLLGGRGLFGRAAGYWVVTIVSILVSYWFPMVILFLIYLLGKRANNGLYSRSGPVAKDMNVEEGTAVAV